MPIPNLELHFLDVGTTKYGDCILIRHGEKRILIDGAHPGDVDLIAGQLDTLLGGTRPHQMDLLVLTHCHLDHIGCLPKLVSDGIITAIKAYIADIALGWGTHQPDALPEAVDARAAGVLALLREEHATSLKPAELDAAIADALGLRGKLQHMMDDLVAAGTEIIPCTGDEDRGAITAEFAEIGLTILGPTKAHLRLCADQIAREQRDALELLNDARRTDSRASNYELLQRVASRRFGQDGPLLADGFKEGYALNCQSIILCLEFGGKKMLLAGDMQFAEPDVDGIEAEMAALRATVQAHGPYDLVKTCHHTSHNGWDEALGDELLPNGRNVYLVHSGGLNDPSHPARQVLKELRTLRTARANDLTYLRTDRNGQISFTIAADGSMEYTKAKGRVNNFQPNRADETIVPVMSQPVSAVQPQFAASGEFVEIITRIPNRKMRVTVTVDVDPAGVTSIQTGGESGFHPDPPIRFSLPADRQLPPLLFVTDEVGLGRKIGATNARAAIAGIQAGGQMVLNERFGGRTAMQAAAIVRQHLQNGVQGVVLLGGADVVPSVRLDVLGPDLRPQLQDPESDPDDFIVWNDEIYGDRDNDELPELPVSRIADGGSAQLVSSALSAAAHTGQARFGIRNVRRPFANAVFRALPGNQAILVSEPTHTSQIRPRDVQSDIAYFMLHGDDSDTRRFWGEAPGGPLEAFSVEQVPANFRGVVFTGCCWGALTTTRRALHFSPGQAVDCRAVNDSIALRFIAGDVR